MSTAFIGEATESMRGKRYKDQDKLEDCFRELHDAYTRFKDCEARLKAAKQEAMKIMRSRHWYTVATDSGLQVTRYSGSKTSISVTLAKELLPAETFNQLARTTTYEALRIST